MPGRKQPISILAIIHDPELNIVLLERAAHPGFWQSVTGSREGEESSRDTAQREIAEETGIHCAAEALTDWHLSYRFEIFARWRDRYAEGVSHNTEHVFSLCVPGNTPIEPALSEHRAVCWLPWSEAADRCFSWSNREAILMLGLQAGQPTSTCA